MQFKIFLRNSLSLPPPNKIIPPPPTTIQPPYTKTFDLSSKYFSRIFKPPPQTGGGACYELIQSQQ